MSAAFCSTFSSFDDTSDLDKLGRLIEADATRGFATHYTRQTEAWLVELRMLSRVANECIERCDAARHWTILLEFDIPRRGKRPDAVVIAGDLIFVLEFKVGAVAFAGSDQWQVLSYGLDLRDFHSESEGRHIVPILAITGRSADSAAIRDPHTELPGSSGVKPVQLIADATGNVAAALICDIYDQLHNPNVPSIDASAWDRAAYRPSPTIIEAAQRIFAGHGVADISHAFAFNLDATCKSLIKAVHDAQQRQRRAICFVTGIPGAGKTLAGLNLAHDPFFRAEGNRAAVFLSGNGPLVKIVRAALVRDRQRSGQNAADAKRTVSTFIDNVHRFIGAYGIKDPDSVPYENVIIFDEAQRAWDRDAVESQHGVQKSEPALVLDAMERATNWSAVIALVGGGQEIHKGEAGLSEWGRALSERPVEWDIYASPTALHGGDAVAGHVLFKDLKQHLQVHEIPSLHLDVSVRSPRARRIAEWVNAIINGNTTDCFHAAGGEFPVVITRDLQLARRWLREKSEGKQSIGLLASSGALRLRAHGIEVSSGFRRGYAFEEWFLADHIDTRSSNSLEVAATEFECQGLELDWTCVCWGHDFVYSAADEAWLPRKFRGSKWQVIRREAEAQYARNKYRVLLTRARRGMVIWIPEGSEADFTRDPSLLNATAAFLQRCGLSTLETD